MTLKDARKKKGYTQIELGSLLGISQRAIGNYETNARHPSLDIAKRLAEFLDVELLDIWRMIYENDKSA